MLVLIGATEDGTKEWLAVVDGFRESKESWGDLLRELKAHGMTHPPKLATGEGSLGFWIALQEEFGTSVNQQRCWVPKTANVLDKLPKSLQGRAKERLHAMYLAPTCTEALAAYDRFQTHYRLKYPQACDCLQKDKAVLFRFYDFPAEHGSPLRTTNPIESTFATVRLRTRAHQRVWVPHRHPDDGLQAWARSPEIVAPPQRSRPDRQSDHGRSFYRWGRKSRKPTCRLVTKLKDASSLRTQHLTISRRFPSRIECRIGHQSVELGQQFRELALQVVSFRGKLIPLRTAHQQVFFERFAQPLQSPTHGRLAEPEPFCRPRDVLLLG